MPANPIALELLEETGPLAVSSANLTGKPAAITADDAQAMLGDSVAVYLDAGPSDDRDRLDHRRRDESGRRRGAGRSASSAREPSDRARLREVLGDLLEPDPRRTPRPRA